VSRRLPLGKTKNLRPRGQAAPPPVRNRSPARFGGRQRAKAVQRGMGTFVVKSDRTPLLSPPACGMRYALH
jgi:hypothetical protein